MNQPKVVPLQHDRKPATIPPIAASVRQQARRQLLVLLKDLLNCTDDALFEMADRSQSDADHHLYFDSMRQIRLHRNDIQTQFVDQLNAAFDRAFLASAAEDVLQAGEDPENIGLMSNDDLEVSVAISGIVSKITSQFSLPIMELTRRLDHLAKHVTINERLNPLGPQMLSEAFATATECLEVDIRIRIILLKLFERTVMQRMAPVYEGANQVLSEAGVLKDLRRDARRNPRASAPPPGPVEAPRPNGPITGGAHAAGFGGPASQGGGSAANGYGTGGFGTIQTLMAGVRGTDSGPAPSPGTIIATPQLLSVLSAVQAESGQQQLSMEQAPTLLDLRQMVVSRAPDVTGEALTHLGRADEDVVNFIGMLFDYILNDRNLAIPMKALIARLQIPIVKLAILDKAFFDRSSHPARLLLNELSSAGIGWSSAAELKRDRVYDKVESVVVRVLNGFSDNPTIFSELLEELRHFRTQDTERNVRIEQRIRDTESGKARTLAAKQAVQKVINQKASGLRLPRDLARFLSEVWCRVLVYTSLREGDASPAWAELIDTLDDLLWCVQPLDNLSEINRRDAMRAELMQRLAGAMELIGLPETEREDWAVLITVQLEEVTAADRAFLDDDDVPRVTEACSAMHEIVLAPPEEVSDSYQGEPAAPTFVEEINALSEGNWVEIDQSPEPVLRCKLAAIVKPGDRYVFVNRRGMKVAEKTRMELARNLQDQRLVVLNDSEVFDRALQAVIGNLRQVQNQGVTS